MNLDDHDQGADELLTPTPEAVTDSTLRRPVDPELDAILAAARADRLASTREVPVDVARARFARSRANLPPGPAMARIDDVTIPREDGSVPGRLYEPREDASDLGTIVYLHGGGWVLSGIDETDALCRAMADASGCDVLSVGYRLAPEHPFPAAVQDTDAAIAWAAARRPDRPLAIVGDSAGGNLAAVGTIHARDRGGPEIAFQVLIYPVTQPESTTPSYTEHGDNYLLSADNMRWFWDQYVPDVEQRQSPDASPLLASTLAGLPSALVIVAEYDPLRDETLAYAQRLADEGVAVTVDRYETMVHGFVPLVGALTAADTAVASIGAAIAAALGQEG